MYLLDVNVLIALAWDAHEHHASAHTWFAQLAGASFATCNVTQSGFVRLSLNQNVVHYQIGMTDVFKKLESFTKHPNHTFCEDGPLQTELPAWQKITNYKHVTDTNLCLIAHRHRRKLVTFDRGLQNRLSNEERSNVEVIPP